MSLDQSKRAYKNDFLLAAAMIAAGLLMCALALVQLSSSGPLMAQATQPLQSSPPSAQDNAPAESKPGGGRPTTPAPEPARPDAQAQKEGAKPALPPAPAEKMAPPIQQK
jgi:predicted cobalt transporter CbtA